VINGVNKAMITPDKALQRLLEGNKRFYTDTRIFPAQDMKRVLSVSEKQEPFAAILSCSDSRIPASVIFDQGIGDIFSVRVAGHVCTDEAIASLEYAVEQLKVKLIMVLGHSNCGAVITAINTPSYATDYIKNLLEHIKPAICCKNDDEISDIDFLNICTKNHIFKTVEKLKSSNSLISEKIKNNEIRIVGAFYDLKTGIVEVL